jgi:hypothetical protein
MKNYYKASVIKIGCYRLKNRQINRPKWISKIKTSSIVTWFVVKVILQFSGGNDGLLNI